MNASAQLKLIDRAFRALQHAGIPASWGTVDEKLYDMNLASEREHRRRAFGRGQPSGISAPTAAKLFTVRHLAESLETPDKWQVKDVPHIRLEAIYAQAYVAESGDKIRAAFESAGVALADILALDYSELM